jgi:hypothetical protein
VGTVAAIVVALFGGSVGFLGWLWNRDKLTQACADLAAQRIQLDETVSSLDLERKLRADELGRLRDQLDNYRRDLEEAADALSRCETPAARREHLRRIGLGLLPKATDPTPAK